MSVHCMAVGMRRKLINVTKGRQNDVQEVELWDSQELPVAYFSNFYFLKNIYSVNCMEWTCVHLIADCRSEISVGFLAESSI